MKNKANLDSPNQIQPFHEHETLATWVNAALSIIKEDAYARIMTTICGNLAKFVRWAEESHLVFEGCTRNASTKCTNELCNGKYHGFTEERRYIMRAAGITLDGRANGPAISAFLFAKGERPQRYGSKNGWSIHHIYSGKFPYPGKNDTLHATKDPKHFTETAGLVALHPLADNAADEFPFFSWLLRAEAFIRFEYDPDQVFHDLPSTTVSQT